MPVRRPSGVTESAQWAHDFVINILLRYVLSGAAPASGGPRSRAQELHEPGTGRKVEGGDGRQPPVRMGSGDRSVPCDCRDGLGERA
jgi:hypothetical protein